MNFNAQYVCYQLSVSFRLSCDRCHILDLDSSTEHKFSRHLIFHLPNAVFTNNIHAGTCTSTKLLQNTLPLKNYYHSLLLAYVLGCWCAGSWIHHICDLLRNLKKASERGVVPQQVWTTTFTPNTPTCPPGMIAVYLYQYSMCLTLYLISITNIVNPSLGFYPLLLKTCSRRTSDVVCMHREGKYKSDMR